VLRSCAALEIDDESRRTFDGALREREGSHDPSGCEIPTIDPVFERVLRLHRGGDGKLHELGEWRRAKSAESFGDVLGIGSSRISNLVAILEILRCRPCLS